SILRIEQVENNHFSKHDEQTSESFSGNSSNLNTKNLSYRYPNSNEEIIKNLNLKIPAGSKVAILGRSGAGKSTLLKLIAGALDPSSGSITIDGKEVQESYLAKAVAVLNQKPH